MITEPEFEGGGPGLPERPEPGGPHGRYDDAGAPGVRPRPWQWALGGALLASALWAGAWWVAADRADRPPPLRYGLGLSLCDEAKLPALSRVAEVAGWEYTPRLLEHPGVDMAVCMLRKPPQNSEVPRPWLSYEAQVSVALHKRNDPEPEFGAEPVPVGWIGMGKPDWRSVPGLGERALISEAEYGRHWRLTVLDGGAVFTVDVTAWTFGVSEPGDGTVVAGAEPVPDPPKPDSDAIQAAMIDDMHALMKALRTEP
ncbi:hypothetical protein ACWGDE_17020 [Streptomyces sp. NPDC054956]